MIPSEPPKVKSKLPKKLKLWIEDVRQWLIETQALAGNGLLVRETAKGRELKLDKQEVAEIADDVADDREDAARSDNQYIMGETAGGSTTPLTPAAPPASTSAQTDTWDIEAPPHDIGGAATHGVKNVMTLRIVAVPALDNSFFVAQYSGGAVTYSIYSTGYKAFRRTLEFDSAGNLIFVSAETQVATLSYVAPP